MSADVIELAAVRAEREPHLAGEARCTNCGHQWAAVAPIGTWQLECPSCETLHGLWRCHVGADDGDLTLRCKCGCEAMTAYIDGGRKWVRCMRCGTDQTDALFNG